MLFNCEFMELKYLKITTRLLILMLSFVFMANANANEAEFNTLLKELENHPALLRINYNADSKKQKSKQAKGLPDPNIIIGVDNVPVDNPSFDEYLPTSKVIGF